MMPKQPRSDKLPWYKRWLFKSSLLLALVAAFLAGVISAGRWGLEHLRGRDRYDIAFSDIACEPPVGMDRVVFVDEVRGLTDLPKTVHLLDENLTAQLREGFAQHPWVEKVEDVTKQPPNKIIVKLVHRVPVLAVKVGAKLHAVDGHGILLPNNAPTGDLKNYDGVANPPRGPPGTRWGDPNVEAAARKLKK